MQVEMVIKKSRRFNEIFKKFNGRYNIVKIVIDEDGEIRIVFDVETPLELKSLVGEFYV